MLELPRKLVPSRVVIKRLPVHAIGNLSASNPLINPSVQLTSDQLPVVIDLEFNNLPYSGLGGSGSMYSKVSEKCNIEEYGWQQAWDFFDLASSGAREFVVPQTHAAWKCLDGELTTVLFGKNTYWWRITDIKESGNLAKVRSFVVTIVQGRKAIKTFIASYGITSGIGRSLNQLVAPPALTLTGRQEITVTAGKSPVATEEGLYSLAEVPGSIPVDYKTTVVDSIVLEYNISSQVILDSAVTYKSGRTRLVDKSLVISDSYTYNYSISKVFTILN